MSTSTLRCQNDSNLLSVKNAHERDLNITFVEEGHKYFIRNDATNVISCTTYIHNFFSEFDSDSIIKSICSSLKWKNDKTYKYYKMAPEVIKKMWDDNGEEASKLGTNMHAMIEHFYNDLEVEYTDDMIDFCQFVDFYNDHEDLKIYRTEWIIYVDELKLAGSIDAIFMNEDGTLTIGDWKRSKQISFNSFGYSKKYGKYPFEHMEDCNYNHYSLQLNLYRIILETYYGYRVKDMFLGVFHPDNKDGKYLKIEIPRLEKEAKMLLSYREETLKLI